MKVISISQDQHLIIKEGGMLRVLEADCEKDQFTRSSFSDLATKPHEHAIIFDRILLYTSKDLLECRFIVRALLDFICEAHNTKSISIEKIAGNYREIVIEQDSRDAQLREDEPNEIC